MQTILGIDCTSIKKEDPDTCLSDALDFNRGVTSDNSSNVSQQLKTEEFEEKGDFFYQIYTPLKSKNGKGYSDGSSQKKCSRKPPFSFSKIIQDLLLEHGRTTVKEIFKKLAHKFPEHFNLNDKRWQASVRSCLTQKDHFVNEKMEGKGSFWKLSDTVLRKLNSHVFESGSLAKENLPIDRGSWNSGKYVTIAPKPFSHSEKSLDGSIPRLHWNTPLKPRDINESRLCHSEDKNLFREKNLIKFNKDFSKTDWRIQPIENSITNISKAKRKKEFEFQPKSKVCKRLLDNSASNIHFKINCNSSSNGGFLPLEQVNSIKTENASFNVEDQGAESLTRMTTFRDHPDFPFSTSNYRSSNQTYLAGETISEQQDVSPGLADASAEKCTGSINDNKTSSNPATDSEAALDDLKYDSSNDAQRCKNEGYNKFEDVFEVLHRDSQSSFTDAYQLTDSGSVEFSILDDLEFDET